MDTIVHEEANSKLLLKSFYFIYVCVCVYIRRAIDKMYKIYMYSDIYFIYLNFQEF